MSKLAKKIFLSLGHMKSVSRQKVLAALAGAMLIASVACAYALSMDDAKAIVLKQFPTANIYKTEFELEDGRAIYEIKFTTDKIYKGEFEIDAETGNIVKQKLKYR